MLYFDRIDIFEGIDVNKRRESKECDICHYWYFLGKGFKFQPNVCNRCHDLLMISMNLSDIAILNIKGSNYRCIISGISKREAIILVKYIDLSEKKWNIIKHKYLLLHIKIGKEILKLGETEIEKISFTAIKIKSF